MVSTARWLTRAGAILTAGAALGVLICAAQSTDAFWIMWIFQMILPRLGAISMMWTLYVRERHFPADANSNQRKVAHDRFAPATSPSHRKPRSTTFSHHATGAASDAWSHPDETELRVPSTRELPEARHIEFSSASTLREKDVDTFDAHVLAV